MLMSREALRLDFALLEGHAASTPTAVGRTQRLPSSQIMHVNDPLRDAPISIEPVSERPSCTMSPSWPPQRSQPAEAAALEAAALTSRSKR